MRNEVEMRNEVGDELEINGFEKEQKHGSLKGGASLCRVWNVGMSNI